MIRSFYRTSHGLEVDLLIDRGDRVDAFEIQFSSYLTARKPSPLGLGGSAALPLDLKINLELSIFLPDATNNLHKPRYNTRAR